MTAGPLILASRSPQRRAILEQLGVRFRVVVPEVEELAAGDPRALVEENAARKARAVDGSIVLGVDTTVAIEGRTFGKPRDQSESELFLRWLSGRTHQVWSGICLRRSGEERCSHAVTQVRFRALGERDIAWYIESGEWRERAGAYAIQGRGAALVDSIEGDFWNVVGLPVAELLRLAPELIVGGPR